MNRLLAAFSVAAFMAPGLALAQTASPPPQMPRTVRPAPDQGHMMMQHMQMMQLQLQMSQLHRQAKTQMLAALSPAHRTLLETMIGQLALSEHPDRRAAAAKLDAVLSPSERAAILKIHADTAVRAGTLQDNAHRQMLSSMPADVRTQAERLHAAMRQEMANRPKRTPDAGRLLLGMARHGEGMMAGMGRMHRGMMGPGMMGPGDGMLPAAPEGGMRRRLMTPPQPTPSPSP